jgi:hypothetical protein
VFSLKRAPTLALGLFLYLLHGVFPLGAADNFSFSADAGPLLVTGEGAALYWKSGFSFSREQQFSSTFTLGQVMSDLPWARGTMFGGLGTVAFDTPRFGLELSFGAFQHGLFRSKTEAFTVHNEGGQLFLAGVKAPVHIGEWTIAPSFAYASGSWDEGSLYWFFGKPRLPSLAVSGLSLAYQARHEMAFQYLFLNPAVHTNDDERLFHSRMDAFAAYYRFSLEIASVRLGGSLGAIHAAGEAEGSLTASNQHFAYFPYRYYNLDSSINLQAGFAALDALRSFSVFQCRIAVGAAHIFRGKGAADIHYQHKALFGGDEAFDAPSLDLGGTGAAFILLDAGLGALPLGKQHKLKLTLGLKKLFVLPWGYERSAPGASALLGASGSPAHELLRTALLSGLSLYGFLRW